MGNPVNPSENSESPTVLLRKLHHWRMAFFGVVILLAGMLGGAAVTLLAIRHLEPRRPLPPGHAVKLLLARLDGPLHLTGEQRQQVEPILQEHMVRLDQIQLDGQKAIAQELRLLSEQLAGVLTPDQMRLWERLFSDLPGSIRHIPEGRGPGPGRGPAPPGGWRGPPDNRRGLLQLPPGSSPSPDANAVPHN
jgi:hypothetical protein